MHTRAVKAKYFQLKKNVASFVIIPFKVSWKFENNADKKSKERNLQWRPLLLMSLTMLRHTPLVEVNQATVSLVIIDNSTR